MLFFVIGGSPIRPIQPHSPRTPCGNALVAPTDLSPVFLSTEALHVSLL
jgi:hypothetical protein